MESRPSDLSADISVLVPEGRLDARAAPALEQELAALEARGVTQIVINFSRASYVSSSSLRAMLIHTRKLRQASGDLKLCALTEKIAEVLRITGLDTILDIFPSENLAAQAFLTPPRADMAPPTTGHGRENRR